MGKRKQAVNAPTVYLHLDTSSYTDVIREADPEDSWDASDTSTSWTANGIHLSEKDGHHALPADFPIVVGDTVFVVYAVYSTGDSFHRGDGAYLEVISFHKNGTLAHKNAANVKARLGNDDKYAMTIEFDNGKKVTRHCPWDGYFESLDYVQVDSFTVGASKRY